jgi:hypothetical protein
MRVELGGKGVSFCLLAILNDVSSYIKSHSAFHFQALHHTDTYKIKIYITNTRSVVTCDVITVATTFSNITSGTGSPTFRGSVLPP